ncbi:MAG: hypothetical protein LUD81_06655, partial [Clostridiales bacterium]|nr:hypothetical protein [Clostridiales bacterium]
GYMKEKKFANIEKFLEIMASMQELQGSRDYDDLDRVIESAAPETQLSEDELEYVYAARGSLMPKTDDSNQNKRRP